MEHPIPGLTVTHPVPKSDHWASWLIKKALDLHLGGTKFKSQPDYYCLFWMQTFVDFLSFSKWMLGSYLEIVMTVFFQTFTYPSFMITVLSYLTPYNIFSWNIWNAIVKCPLCHANLHHSTVLRCPSGFRCLYIHNFVLTEFSDSV